MTPAETFLTGLAKTTQRVAAGDLRAVARIAFPELSEPGLDVPWHTLRVDQGVAVCAALQARYAPGTANRMVAHLRGAVKACYRAGLVPWDTQLRLLAALPKVRGNRVKQGRSLTWPETQRLLAAADDPEERALLAVTAGVGLRRAEVVALTWDRFSRAKDGTWDVRILGKGNREDLRRLTVWAAEPLEAWRRRCPARPKVFRWAHGTSLRDVLTKTAQKAGLGPVAPHDLRRTFFALCVLAGLKLPTIKRLMRHASISTTMLYDCRPDEEVRRESAALDTLDDLTDGGGPGNGRGGWRPA